MFTENIFLDDFEKKMFLNEELTYLIELYNIGNTHTIKEPMSKTLYNIDFEGNNPTKYIMWYLQREMFLMLITMIIIHLNFQLNMMTVFIILTQRVI